MSRTQSLLLSDIFKSGSNCLENMWYFCPGEHGQRLSRKDRAQRRQSSGAESNPRATFRICPPRRPSPLGQGRPSAQGNLPQARRHRKKTAEREVEEGEAMLMTNLVASCFFSRLPSQSRRVTKVVLPYSGHSRTLLLHD